MLITIHFTEKDYYKKSLVAVDHDSAFFVVFKIIEPQVNRYLFPKIPQGNNMIESTPRPDLFPCLFEVFVDGIEATFPWYERYQKLGVTGHNWKRFNEIYNVKEEL